MNSTCQIRRRIYFHVCNFTFHVFKSNKRSACSIICCITSFRLNLAPDKKKTLIGKICVNDSLLGAKKIAMVSNNSLYYLHYCTALKCQTNCTRNQTISRLIYSLFMHLHGKECFKEFRLNLLFKGASLRCLAIQVLGKTYIKTSFVCSSTQ